MKPKVFVPQPVPEIAALEMLRGYRKSRSGRTPTVRSASPSSKPDVPAATTCSGTPTRCRSRSR